METIQYHKNMSRIKKYFLVIIVAIASICSVGYVDSFFETSKNLDIFTTLYKELNIFYVDDTDPGKLMNIAIDAMLESLDPYTTFIPESEKEDFAFMTTGQYGGIGAIIMKRDQYVHVREPYEGFPADKAGLKAGDKFLEIAGKSAEGKSTSDVSKVLKGEPNSNVTVLIEREGVKKPFEVVLTREEIKVSSIPYYGMVSDSIAYIRMRSFTRGVSKEVIEALEELKIENNVKGLIFDLRGNPGGLLNEAINTSNIFINKGEVIVNTIGKISDWNKTYTSRFDVIDENIPLAVLISRSSASASEIVAGVMQDFDRGVILGQRSFGKGLVQQTRKLSYNAQLKVTTAKYYIPSGRCIQALDYSNRDEDGSVGKTPDSLRTEFKTLNGRSVFDGGGVTPDIGIEPRNFSNILRSIISKNYIFDFVNDFYRKNHSISGPEYELDDALYSEFKQYLLDKDYEYQTKTEKAIEKLIKQAEDEEYIIELQEQLDAIQNKMAESKNSDIDRYKDQIIEYIESEIVTRYFYQKGSLQSSLKDDVELARAIEVLEDARLYKSILDGTFEAGEKEEE
jgi:carboxyl-terminal processing protease